MIVFVAYSAGEVVGVFSDAGEAIEQVVGGAMPLWQWTQRVPPWGGPERRCSHADVAVEAREVEPLGPAGIVAALSADELDELQVAIDAQRQRGIGVRP